MKAIELTEDEVAVVVEQVDLLLYKGKLSQQQHAQARRVRKMLVNKLSGLKEERDAERDSDDVDSDKG